MLYVQNVVYLCKQKRMMMKKTIFVCVGFLLALSYGGCSHSDSEERTENLPVSKDSIGNVPIPEDSTENISAPEDSTVNLLVSSENSGCKYNQETNSTRGSATENEENEVIQFECTTDGYLLIKHVNSIFCCEANITTTATVNEDIITIKEYAPPITDCICPYDVDMKIGPLKNQSYTIVVDKGYPVNFSFTLSFPSSKGEVIVDWE